MSSSSNINALRSPLNLAYSALFSSCFPNGYLQSLDKHPEEGDLEIRQIARHMDTQVEYLPKGFDLFVPDLINQSELYAKADSFFRREIVKKEIATLDYLNECPVRGDINLEALPDFVGSNTYAVCWSGGMDSLSAALHAVTVKKADNLILIHVNYNGPYSPKESGRAYQTYENLVDLVHTIRTDRKFKVDTKNIIFLELKVGNEAMAESLLPLGYIMPGRNGFIATTILDTFKSLGLLDAGLREIYMTGHYRSVEGQYTGAVDKNYHFFGELSNIYNWHSSQAVHVTSPFLSISKEEMLSYGYVKLLGKASDSKKIEELFFKCIDSTVSCYDPVHDRCGNCSSCYKRWQALKSIPAYKEVYAVPVEQAPRYNEFASREAKKGR
ncbi:7-cyano-7-deazaguanine synthase [Yersinia ruckeri]|uniref:7-cyano-7-deazaguanine synthase n=1 Tax=Yersinia ruckeri TaxID=29486 RepID=UPI002237E676|nr:7-cyano-7-deazaguanine synthase [Yersinia ruckeri]MCW6598877.1 7-cyano-7-deazaguanine synthase [Yersinia ruckeri]